MLSPSQGYALTCGRAKDPAAHFRTADQPSAIASSCNWDQAASFPEALATWVAIASIKAGDRQS